MKKELHKVQRYQAKDIMTLCKALLIALQVAIFVIGWDLMQPKIRFFAQTSLLLFVIYAIILFWMHSTYKSLRVGSSKLIHLFTAQFLTLFVSNCLLLMIATLSIRQLPNLWLFIAVFIVQVAVSLLWCYLAHQLFHAITPPKRTAVVFDRPEDESAFDGIFEYTGKYAVAKRICVQDFQAPYDELLAELSDIESVFLADVPQEIRSLLFRYATNHRLSVNLYPTMDDVLLSTARRRFIANIPMLKVSIGTAPLPVRFIKRAMDIIGSGLLLIVASPIMAVVAILIRREDHGPIFYRQKRLTIGGKEFEILKFRSMRTDAEKDGVARLAAEKDNRITGIGQMIRATRLDELPQLWNIFKGDMSLVGPRPERPEIARQYMQVLPQFDARLKVKAGLTGYAQVNGKYNTTPAEKLQMDLMYISEMSIALDVKLILQTVQIMMKKESTEGVTQGQTTAMK